MTKLLCRMARDEDGAVTIDWVVLTAFVCALALAVVYLISVAATDPATGLGDWLSSFVTP